MKLRTMGFLFLLALAISGSAFAQDGGPDYPDYDVGGSGGGSGGCSVCAASSNHLTYCMHLVANPNGWYQGTYLCTAYNVAYGPGYCQMSGGTCFAIDVANKDTSPMTEFDQTRGIESYLRSSGLMNPDDLNDFIAKTDYTLRDVSHQTAMRRRLAAYRAKFAALAGHELRLGAVPVIPHQVVKAPATTTASTDHASTAESSTR